MTVGYEGCEEPEDLEEHEEYPEYNFALFFSFDGNFYINPEMYENTGSFADYVYSRT